MPTPKDDLEAVRAVAAALEGFDPREQERIIRWAREKLGLSPAPARPPASAFGGTAQAVANADLTLRPGLTVAEAERLLIRETLAFTKDNKTRAAEMLGISLKTLHNKLAEYKSQPQS